jgi:hypothetical protein
MVCLGFMKAPSKKDGFSQVYLAIWTAARFHCEDWFEGEDRRAEVFDRTWS